MLFYYDLYIYRRHLLRILCCGEMQAPNNNNIMVSESPFINHPSPPSALPLLNRYPDGPTMVEALSLNP